MVATMVAELLAKSQENVKSAELLFDATCYNASANRAYYAAIHAAAAAIFHAGLLVEIDHRRVLSLFANTLISSRKLYSSDLKSQLYDLQNVRNTADYSIENVGKKKALRQLVSAHKFVSTIREKIGTL
jgi:uncharacterized protein (UPF0332 family)